MTSQRARNRCVGESHQCGTDGRPNVYVLVTRVLCLNMKLGFCASSSDRGIEPDSKHVSNERTVMSYMSYILSCHVDKINRKKRLSDDRPAVYASINGRPCGMNRWPLQPFQNPRVKRLWTAFAIQEAEVDFFLKLSDTAAAASLAG